MRASDLMTTDVMTLPHDATVAEAIAALTELEVRHVPLVKDGRLVAVLSDRDLRQVDGLIAVGVGQKKRETNVLDAQVSQLIGATPITCSPDASADDVIDILVGERIGAVVVVDDDQRVLGIVSTIDVLAAAHGRLG